MELAVFAEVRRGSVSDTWTLQQQGCNVNWKGTWKKYCKTAFCVRGSHWTMQKKSSLTEKSVLMAILKSFVVSFNNREITWGHREYPAVFPCGTSSWMWEVTRGDLCTPDNIWNYEIVQLLSPSVSCLICITGVLFNPTSLRSLVLYSVWGTLPLSIIHSIE